MKSLCDYRLHCSPNRTLDEKDDENSPLSAGKNGSLFSLTFLADPPSRGVSSRFTHVRLSVRLCVHGQLTKLFNIFGSG